MLPILGLLFFISGASALIYQVVWLRLLSLVFGVTVYAASTVLASFMAGLAIGSALAGRLADRVRRPLAWFGAAELLIAATALVSPVALDAIGSLYVRFAADAGSTTTLTTVRLICSALVVLPPTVLMGSTLPLVLRSAGAETAGIASRISLLYGLNTCGAIAGALLAGFVLIGAVGLTRTFQLAAALNVIVGLSAIALSRRSTLMDSAARPSTASSAPNPGPSIVPLIFFLSGFTSLALEVVWFRTLVLYFPATTYAFTAMLATVLAGIALGSLAVTPLLRRRRPTLIGFGLLHAGVAIAALAGCKRLAAVYAGGGTLADLVTGATMTILPAALMMGAAFPIGCRLWLAGAEDSGRRVGLLYSVNVAGAILGSIVAGFALLPWLGSARSLRALAGLSVLSGLIALLAATGRRSRLVWASAVIVVFAIAARQMPDPFVTGLMKRYRDAGRIFMRDEGVQTTVSVHVRELGSRQLYLDGLHQASDGRDVVLMHRMIGHLPVLLHRAPTRALVIGLGGGATAGAVSLHPHLDVEIVELAPGVVRAAEWFTHINEDVLHKPQVTLRIDDARNYLMVGRGKYDVITADVIQPTHAGAGLLYSEEYFSLARRALTDDGVMVQWIGQRSDTYYRLIARTFQRVFPETTVWVNGSLLIGSVKPLVLNRDVLAAQIAGSGLEAALTPLGFGTADALLAQFTAGPAALRRFLGEGPVLTDDKPSLEYYLSLPQNDPPVNLNGLKSGA